MKWVGKHTVFDDLMIGGVLLTPPDPATYSYELTLPNDDGSSGQVLSTNGSGVLSWVANGVAVPNALTMGTGFDLSSGAGSWDGSVAETISIDWTEFSSISIGPTDNAMFYIRRSPNSSAAAGGDLELRGGTSGSGTNLAAGDIELHTGLGTGSGTAGLIKFQPGMNTTSGTGGHSGVLNSYMASTTAQNTFTITEPGATNADTLEFKVAAHGASTITTVDVAAAAANLDFVIDGQFSVASTGIDISGAGVISNATWQGTDVGIAYGGTGQSTAQAAIDALSAVSGASTNECLIKDGSGNATWAAQTDTTYSAGDGLDLSGTTFSTDLKSNGGLVIESTELAVDLGASSITGTLDVGDGGTGATTLTSNAILTGAGTGAIQAEAEWIISATGLGIGDGSNSTIDKIWRTAAGIDIVGGDLSIGAGDTRPGVGNNRAGGDLLLYGGLSTGNALGGGVKIYTGWEGVSGTGQLGPALHSEFTSTAAINSFTIYEPNLATADYFNIIVGVSGATTIETIDAAAAAANLTFSIDGTFEVDTGANEIDLTTTGTLDVNANALLMNLTDSSSIVLTASEAAEDLIIRVAGAHDSSLILRSDGTGTDALQINASVGSLDIDSADNITIDAADLITITTADTGADGLISLVSGVAGANTAIHLDGNANAASVVDIDAGILDIDVTGITTLDTTELTITGKTIMPIRKYVHPGTDAGNHTGGDVWYFGSTTGMTAGLIYYLNTSATWTVSNCDAEVDSTGMLAVALGDESDNDGMLLRGFVTLFEIQGAEDHGLPIYLNAVDGGTSVAAPTANGHFVRIVGYAIHNTNDSVYFNPDNTWVELA